MRGPDSRRENPPRSCYELRNRRRGAAASGRSGKMGEILGIGVTHYPGLIQPDEAMAGLLNRTLNSEQVPDALKDPARWPEPMRKEWADPLAAAQGTPAPAGQRLPRGAQGTGCLRSRSRADLGRRPVREFPRGRRPVVLRLRLRRDRVRAPMRATPAPRRMSGTKARTRFSAPRAITPPPRPWRRS